MDNNIPTHKSVMMNEVLEILNPKSNETYIAVSYTHLTLPTILRV